MKTIDDAMDIVQNYRNLEEKIFVICKDLLAYFPGYMEDFDILDDEVRVGLNDGFDHRQFRFPAKYLFLKQEEYLRDYQEKKQQEAAEKERLEREKRKKEEKEKEAKEYQEFLRLKSKFELKGEKND